MLGTSFLAALFAVTSAQPTQDLIKDLPGLTWNINYQQYSGYLNASSGHYLQFRIAFYLYL